MPTTTDHVGRLLCDRGQISVRCAIEACYIRKYVFLQVQCQEPIIAICLVDLMDFFFVLPEVSFMSTDSQQLLCQDMQKNCSYQQKTHYLLLMMLCKILWIAVTRLRRTWTGLSQASKPTDPMSTEQEPHDRGNHSKLSFVHIWESNLPTLPQRLLRNSVRPYRFWSVVHAIPGQPSLLRCYCSCGPASWPRATYVTSPCAHCWLQARVFSFKLELWSMAAAAQDGRTDGPHKNPIQPSRGCTVLYVRCAESTVGRWGNAVALPVCYSDFFPTLVFGLRASYCCNYFMVC